MKRVNLCDLEKVTVEIPKQFAFCLTETQQIIWLYNELIDILENGGGGGGTFDVTIGDNGNWYEWDATSGTFVDSGVSAHPFPYVQPDEPIDAPEFSLWVDTDEEALYIARAEGVGF